MIMASKQEEISTYTAWFVGFAMTKFITARELAITCDRATSNLFLADTRFKQQQVDTTSCSAIRTTAEDQNTVKYGPIATRTLIVAMII